MSEFNLGAVRFDKDTALSAAAALDTLADNLEAAVRAEAPVLPVAAAGADEVSVQAANTLTAVGASFTTQSDLGIVELRKLAAALRDQVSTFTRVEADSVADFSAISTLG
ncbi:MULTISPECIES: PE family protein [Nocardia]|uniref:PE family protein n=1 Tax=Nocardia TaxID=1817 RepID=UPI001892E5DD|nr:MULTISPECIES: PE family protein [Nocardia]MBF6179617.1 PE family protein [Nocardia otitidiscaviarum]MBF6235790.1 PE family protein [Nocardia otitidiscaviarum]